MELPRRVTHPELARTNPMFGRIAAGLWRADPAADAAADALATAGWRGFDDALAGRSAPDAVHALLDDARGGYLDPQRAARAGRLFFRAGPIGGLVLGGRSLIAGYASPAGNKPLIRTGALARDGARRLAETGRFVAEVHRDARPGALGWQIALRVRLMHSQTRRLLLARGDWDHAAWGAPLNQHDLLATALLFSVVWVDGLRALGVDVSDDEAADHWHLWRYVARVMGVEDGLLPTTAAQATAVSAWIHATQGPPDADARALVAALLRPAGGEGPGPAAEGLCRALLGDAVGDALDLRPGPWSEAPRWVAPALRPLTRALRWGPVERGLVRAGETYWERSIALGLGGLPARFAPPEQLR